MPALSQIWQLFEKKSDGISCRACNRKFSSSSSTGTLQRHSIKCSKVHCNQKKLVSSDVILVYTILKGKMKRLMNYNL